MFSQNTLTVTHDETNTTIDLRRPGVSLWIDAFSRMASKEGDAETAEMLCAISMQLSKRPSEVESRIDVSEELFARAFGIYKDRHDRNMWWGERGCPMEAWGGRVVTFAESLRMLVDEPEEKIYIAEEEIDEIRVLLELSGKTVENLDARLRKVLEIAGTPNRA